MEQLSMPWYLTALNFAILGSIVGFVCGAIPLCFGAAKRRIKTGVLGLICCTISGAILNIFLAIPVAAIFVWQISKKTDSVENFQ
jgi:hypothetical protein